MWPSVQTRVTSMVFPSSRCRDTGLPRIATPTSFPRTAIPSDSFAPRTGRLCRCFSATNALACLKVSGTALMPIPFVTIATFGTSTRFSPSLHQSTPCGSNTVRDNSIVSRFQWRYNTPCSDKYTRLYGMVQASDWRFLCFLPSLWTPRPSVPRSATCAKPRA